MFISLDSFLGAELCGVQKEGTFHFNYISDNLQLASEIHHTVLSATAYSTELSFEQVFSF